MLAALPFGAVQVVVTTEEADVVLARHERRAVLIRVAALRTHATTAVGVLGAAEAIRAITVVDAVATDVTPTTRGIEAAVLRGAACGDENDEGEEGEGRRAHVGHSEGEGGGSVGTSEGRSVRDVAAEGGGWVGAV